MALMPLPAEAPARTIPELLARIRRAGPRPILTARSASGYVRTVSCARLPDLVARAATFLERHGAARGDPVGIHLDNAAGLEAIVLHLAAQWLGAVPVPLGTRLSAREIADVVADCGARLVLVQGEQRASAREALPAVALVDCTSGVDELTRRLGPRSPADLVEADLASMLYTSGTSGRAKGVEFDHGNCIACGMELRAAVGLEPHDVYQTAVPYFTSTGAHTNPLLTLVTGAHLVLEPAFDQHETVRRWRLHRTSVYFGVPSMLSLIVRDVDLSTLPDSLRRLVFGGSTTTATGLERLLDAFPGRGLINLYGLTEGGPGGTVLGPDDVLLKPGSVGRRGNGPHTSFRVVREDGADAAVDEVGEIALRSPAVMRGYHQNPEATAVALRGGWLHTTDLGRIDGDGYLWFVDRRKDLVVRGGFNVSTSEIEAVLATFAGIREAAVVGVPHEILGEDLAAYLVVDGELDRAALDAHLRANLADYKRPRRLELVPELPRNAMGKVLKRELRGDPGPAEAASSAHLTIGRGQA